VSCLLVFLILLIYFSKFSCASHQLISASNFRKRENHVKDFDIICAKSVFIKFWFWWVWGGGCSLAAPPLGAPLLGDRTRETEFASHCFADFVSPTQHQGLM
jgi:hypothetical protein